MGQDRRQVVHEDARAADGRVWCLAALLAAGTALAVAAVADRTPVVPGVELPAVVYTMALALVLVAIGLLWAHRRATGHALGPRLTVMVAALGAGSTSTLLVATVEPDALPAGLPGNLVRSVLTTAAGVSLLWALRGPEIDLRGWAPRLTTLGLGLVALTVATAALPATAVVTSTATGLDHAAAAVIWWFAAVIGWRHAKRLREPLAYSAVCAAPLIAGAELVRWAEVHGLLAPTATAALLRAAAIPLLVVGAVHGLTNSAVLHRSQRHAHDVTQSLADEAAADHLRRQAHELHNALLSVESVSARLLTAEALDSADRELLGGAIVDSIDHLGALLEAPQRSQPHDALQRAAVAAWTAPAEPTRVDDVVRRAVLLARARGLTLDLVVEPALSPVCPTALRQAIDNLLINLERHAGRAARGEVMVRRAGQHVEVIVDDDGPGIPMTQRRVLLQPGTRLDADAPGEGLGLAVVAGVVEAAGGSVDLALSLRGGLRATLRLPLDRTRSAGGTDRVDEGQHRVEIGEFLRIGAGRGPAQEAATS